MSYFFLGRGFFTDLNIRHKLDVPEELPSFGEYSMYGQNIGDWVKRSLMDNIAQPHAQTIACSQQASCNGCHTSERRPRDEMENYWLMQQTQQIASRGEHASTCSPYGPQVPQCTCRYPDDHNSMAKVEQQLTSEKQLHKGGPSAEQTVWMNELLDIELQNERLRFQKDKLYQSLAVPDPSLEYPYYMACHDESIYEQEPVAAQLINNLPEKSTTLSSAYQQVPKSAGPSSDASPVSSPRPKAKSSRPRLCHFLLELLANPQQYSNIVEWVDQEKGVFKFLNSSEVASQWGRRRNKPHMKYENFARSLRTYIAKGILTKPRSKLVYRFTSKVY